jgi:hypothetical protein
MENIEDKIREDLTIDETNLGTDLKQQASKFFYWATMRAKAAAKSRQSRTYLDAMKAEVGKKFKDTMAGDDPKVRVTERMLDDYLDTHDQIKAAREALINAQYGEEMLDTAVEAMRQKHYALIELIRSREAERMLTNEYDKMKRDFEEQELKKRQK